MGKVKRVRITNSMIKNARLLSNECRRNLKKTPNYTGLNQNDRFFMGFLGELVFKHYLNINSIKYEHVVNLDGESHGTDFYCWLPDKISIDVKTATKNYYKYMMMPKTQYEKSHCDLYLGVKLNNPYAYIYGCATKDDFVELSLPNLTIPTVGVLFNKLVELPSGHRASIKKDVEKKASLVNRRQMGFV